MRLRSRSAFGAEDWGSLTDDVIRILFPEQLKRLTQRLQGAARQHYARTPRRGV